MHHFTWSCLLVGAMVVLCPGAAAAQQVQGRVVDADTREPIAGAIVQGGGVGATTSEDGSFRITPSAAGPITFGAAGYISRTVLPADLVGGAVVDLRRLVYSLDGMLVTASRTEGLLADAPGSVAVIGSESIEGRNPRRLDGVLNMASGVFAHQDNLLEGSLNAIQVRGLPDQKRTLVMLDGVPLNSAYSGDVQLSGVPTEHVERIEIVKGPASSLYGGSAMGGVVNIITKKAEQRSGRVKLGYGDHLGTQAGLSDLRTWYLSYDDRIGSSLTFSVSHGGQRTDGYAWKPVLKAPTTGTGTIPVTGVTHVPDASGGILYVVGDSGDREVSDDHFGLRIGYEITPAARFDVSALLANQGYSHGAPRSYVRDANGQPVFSGRLTFEDDGSQVLALTERDFLNIYGGKEQAVFSGSFAGRFGSIDTRASIGYNSTDPYYTNFGVGATSEGGPGNSVRSPATIWIGDAQATMPLFGRQKLTIGATVSRADAEIRESNLVDWLDDRGTAELYYSAGGEMTTGAIFLQDEIELTDRITAHLGLRHDWWSTSNGFANDTRREGYPKTYEARRSSFTSPRAALTVRPWTGTTLRTSAGRAFRGPAIIELYRTTTLSSGTTYSGNPDLDPETVNSIDLGVQQALWNGASMTATVFRNDLANMIYRKTITPQFREYANTGRARTKGVELDAEQRLSFGRIWGNYTWTDARILKNETAPETEGMKITRVPAHTGLVSADVEHGDLGLTLTGRYVGKRFGLDDNSDTRNGIYGSYDPFTLFDLRAVYRMGPFDASFSIDNLLDRKYYDYYVAPGRMATVVLGYTL